MTFSSLTTFGAGSLCACPSIQAGVTADLDSACRMTLPALTRAQDELRGCRTDSWQGSAAEEFRAQLTATCAGLNSLVTDVFTLLTLVR